MAELRSIDPRTLIPNPNNPRRTPAPPAMEEQLIASIRAIGIVQPPIVREIDGKLVIRAGDRRVKSAIAAGRETIDVIVKDGDDAAAPMESLSENLIRASMSSVDIWRAVENLEGQGWNEQAIADALALPVRTVRRLKLLAHLHPPMLEAMAKGSMPNEDQLRTIAAATREEQAQVWKKHRQKKGEDVPWWVIANALSKRRIPISAAKFGDDLARAYGIVWEDDLFAPAGEDGRYTTNVDGFFGAQQEWLANNLPERSTILTVTEYGQPQLPKKAEHVYGKPRKDDITGHYIDQRTGEVKTIPYRIPPEIKKSAREQAQSDEASTKPSRPDVTQKGVAMIGDLRTDALHQALDNPDIPNEALIGLLVLALGAQNVSVHTTSLDYGDRETVCERISEGGVLSSDHTLVHAAARDMLKIVLSCRANMSNSGINSRIAGATLGASDHLPSMATEEFLSCLSRQALEGSAAAEGVRVEPRVKDTRVALIAHCKERVWRFPGALFSVTPEEVKSELGRSSERTSWATGNEGDDEAGGANVDVDNDLADLDTEDGEDAMSSYPAAAD